MNENDKVFIKNSCLNTMDYSFIISPRASDPDCMRKIVKKLNSKPWTVSRCFGSYWSKEKEIYSSNIVHMCELTPHISHYNIIRLPDFFIRVREEYLISLNDYREEKLKQILS